MNPLFDHQLLQTRRQFFGGTGLRLGGIALASLLVSPTTQGPGRRRATMLPGLAGFPHLVPKARSLQSICT